MTDGSSREEQPDGDGGGALRVLGPLALGAAVAGAVLAGRKLRERRRGGENRASAKDSDTAEADLATELRGAAGDLVLTLLDRATDRLERTKP